MAGSKLKKIFVYVAAIPIVSGTLFFADGTSAQLTPPQSADYKLRDYSFGSGGTGGSSAGGYSISGISGEAGSGKMSAGSYGIGSGLTYVNQAHVPLAPTFDNPGNTYNRLRIILNPSNNASDSKFAIAISKDGFVTTDYVQNDETVGPALGNEDYQTFAQWGGASGFYVIGLAANTAYQVKVKAIQGKFTETGFGPTASASTSNPTITFAVRTDTQMIPPFSVDFGNMIPNSVNSSPQKIWVDFSTNAENGGKIYLSGSNAGLNSASSGEKIDAVTGNLSVLSEGYGAQGTSVSQASGGPLTMASPYDNVGTDIVGNVDQTMRDIFDSAGPVSGGSGAFVLKVKPASLAAAAADYTDILTIIASGNF